MKARKQIIWGTGIVGIAGLVVQQLKTYKKLNLEIEMAKKNEEIIKLYSCWMRLKQRGESLEYYLKENGYKKIAIYGMHYLGGSLYHELINTDVEIKYIIDKNAERIYSDYSNVAVYTPDEKLEEVDAVVVTAFYYFDEIQEQLQNRLDCPILSLKEILNELSH